MNAPNVRQWLQMLADAENTFRRQHGHANFIGSGETSMARVLLDHGKVYGPRIALPDGVEYGRTKACFENAFNLAFNDDRYTYVEGFAYTPGLICGHHAWAIDTDGNVIDPTWRDGGNECGYCDDGRIPILICDEHGIDMERCSCPEVDDTLGTWDDEECWLCKGTGTSPHEHPSRERTEYLGIPFERDDIVKIIIDSGTYGVLDKVLDRFAIAQ